MKEKKSPARQLQLTRDLCNAALVYIELSALRPSDRPTDRLEVVAVANSERGAMASASEFVVCAENKWSVQER